MTNCKLITLIICLCITVYSNPTLNSPQDQYNYKTGPERISFEEICNGLELISLGACSNAYIRCSYNSIGHCISAILEECPIGEIFNGILCKIPDENCINVWNQEIGKINSETEKLFMEMNFCHIVGPGIYLLPKILCSRQAYVCNNYNEGFAITCLPGMIMLERPFGCFAHPASCELDKISMKQFAPLRQHAIEMHCNQKYFTKQTKMQCSKWYVGCNHLIKDIIYCENGFIFDAKLQKCRKRINEDRCIMPDICMNRKWQTISLGDCNKQFIYCRNHVPEEFVCSEGFIFNGGHCVPIHQASRQCWKCENGQKRHISSHSCNEAKNGQWMEYRCPPGMAYHETGQLCRTDLSCAQQSQCKIGTAFQLKCNEYLFCSSKGIFEHRFCPSFYRWDNEAMLCIPDHDCFSSSLINEPCMEGAIIESSDCKFYHQCFGGEWRKLSCTAYPAKELCKKCYHNNADHVILQQERCNEGDTIANPQDCRNYAICNDGKWKNIRCKIGTFWNQHLKQCNHDSTNCKTFKRAECNHGQYLIGNICNEYLKCLHGSWIVMKCFPGYALDVNTKKCVISNKCIPLNNAYLSVINEDNNDLSLLILKIGTNLESNQQQLHKPCKFGNTIRNEHDCKRYFECTMGEYKDRYCNDNYEFNDESGKCEKEYHCDLSRCRNGRIIESELCGHYQICLNGTWHQRVCYDNRQFINGHCQLTSCSTNTNAIFSKSSCQEGNVLADNINCNRYFICRQGRFQEQFCWNDTIFDKKRGYCVRNTGFMSEASCTGSNIQVDGKDRTAVTDVMRHETCEESNGPTGYRADSTNCHRFYQCTHGKWVSRACPSKLYWNMEKVTCDWYSSNDSCKSRITYV